MAELIPYPFHRLVRRMLLELEAGRAIFDLPRRSFFLGDPAKDYSVRLHGVSASSPLGPAAGPHTQLAQNIVLAWLGGARVFELKTVQVLDRLHLPRPCIDMRNVGYNVEWSQELTLEQSLEEYVKASMLIDILQASGRLPLAPGYRDALFDISVGYDLKGIQSERVQAFIDGMKDARPVVDRLRAQIPAGFEKYRGLDFRTRISGTVTLSTFHGCPPGEIESIVEFLTGSKGLSCTVKLNPTLLGAAELRRLLHGELGYAHVRVPDSAFDQDARWDDVAGFVERLDRKARGLGLGFGVKFSNTLVVDNPGDFLPASEKTVYLSGPPLHVLAMHLVRRFRRQFGTRIPVSFSGGINRTNFPDAVSLGLVPVTVCSDLLGPGGYGRLGGYMEELGKRMDQAGASDIGQFIRKVSGKDSEEAERAVQANTEAYVEAATRDPRYAQAANSKPPRRFETHLALFDCLTCDKCVPACPNNANFTYAMPRIDIPIVKLMRRGGAWSRREDGRLQLDKKHQIANFADFCNECGNCDVFCPEEGGPYRMKPRFFGSLESWNRFKDQDGFYVERGAGSETVHGRFDGREFRLSVSAGRAEYSGEGFKVRFQEEDPAGTVEGEATVEVDLTYFHIMDHLRKAICNGEKTNYVNA